MISEFEKIHVQITPRKKDLLVTILWTLTITLIMIKAYWILYSECPQIWGTLYDYNYPPSLKVPDMLILIGASLVVSMTFSDIKSVLYGTLASLSLSFVFAVIHASLYIWFVLDFKTVFSLVPYAWEWAVWFALLNNLLLMFPWIIGITAVCTIMGLFIRGWLRPHTF